MSKKKVVVDSDNVVEVVDKYDPKRIKRNIIVTLVMLVIAGGLYYLSTPAINFQNQGFCMFVAFTILLIGAITGIKADTNGKNIDVKIRKGRFSKLFLVIGCVGIIGTILMEIISSPLFNSRKYASLINIEESSFTDDIPESETVDNIAIMDTETAKIIGNRTIGSLSDVVSQYEVSDEYTTIDLNGKPMKVASLEYVGFFKWYNNKASGIPGYVLVDPVSNEAKYVKLNTPIKYTKSAYFNQNLERHVQLQYPTAIYEGYYFEIDNEGNPYYICPVLKSNAGLFGAKDVKGVVICDPCTGNSEYYSVGNVPTWVDRVYDGELVTQKYDWYGSYSGGFWNSVIGNKGCKKTTDDYGYKVMNNDVWAYTGVTSVNSDQSNIGFVMMNLRTGESKYYPVTGAEEFSAMSSAEGQVQNLGYKASFPSLINVSGTPTYIMALKDNSGLVKMYALVNVEKYNIVATGNTQNEALKSYKSLLKQYNAAGGTTVIDDEVTEAITVESIQFIAVEGDTVVYITATDGRVFKQKFSEDEGLILIKTGDEVSITYEKTDEKIINIISHE